MIAVAYKSPFLQLSSVTSLPRQQTMYSPSSCHFTKCQSVSVKKLFRCKLKSIELHTSETAKKATHTATTEHRQTEGWV